MYKLGKISLPLSFLSYFYACMSIVKSVSEFINMYSQRLYKIMGILTRLSQKFGSCDFTFDENTNRFVKSTDKIVRRRLLRNYILLGVWGLTTIKRLVKFYTTNNIYRFQLTIGFLIPGVLFATLHSLIFWFGDDFKQIGNGVIVFWQIFQGNYYIFIFITIRR